MINQYRPGPANPHPLVRDIDAFLDETGMTPTVFGRTAMGDPAFVFRLRKGKNFYEATLQKARAQMTAFRTFGAFEDPRDRPIHTNALARRLQERAEALLQAGKSVGERRWRQRQ